MRLCIDVDGTICHLRKESENYSDLLPIVGAAETIKKLKEQGAYIILCTARHMKTCDANVGKVICRQGLTLLQWLEQYGFVYDELWFGKPHADLYIDDKAVEFKGNWQNTNTLIAEYFNNLIKE